MTFYITYHFSIILFQLSNKLFYFKPGKAIWVVWMSQIIIIIKKKKYVADKTSFTWVYCFTVSWLWLWWIYFSSFNDVLCFGILIKVETITEDQCFDLLQNSAYTETRTFLLLILPCQWRAESKQGAVCGLGQEITSYRITPCSAIKAREKEKCGECLE